jgi:hypothetical protein
MDFTESLKLNVDVYLRTEAEKLFKFILMRPGMTEDDYQKLVDEIKQAGEYPVDEFVRNLRVGVKNGYSVEYQINLVKQLSQKFGQSGFGSSLGHIFFI